MFSKLFAKIDNLAAIADKDKYNETWASLHMAGSFQQRYSKAIYSDLYEVLREMNKEGGIIFRLENSNVQFEEFDSLLSDGDGWEININKQSFMGSDSEVVNFFYDVHSFQKWAIDTDPFSKNNPLNNHKCKIEVNGLQSSYGGPNFIISHNIDNHSYNNSLSYNVDYLKSVLRIFAEKKCEVHPERHYVSFGDIDENSYPFYRNSLMCLSVALCDELYENKVVLRGIRMLEFVLQYPHYEKSKIGCVQESLREAFCWVYNENDTRYELRHKLLMDRLTLDLPLSQSYYEGIIPLISNASRQAAERYNYALFERSNEYQQELQRFLKELHGLCDSYSSKVRSILGSFLRDALAGFLTVAITLFARVSDLEKLDSSKVLTYVFYAYTVYLLISCLSQVIIDWRDLYLSEKEIDYWKTVSREYMRNSDFEEHKKYTIRKRKCSAIFQYAIIGLLYLGLAIFSFNAPKLWKELAISKSRIVLQDEVSKSAGGIQNIFLLDSLQDGKDSVLGDSDTTMYHTPGRK